MTKNLKQNLRSRFADIDPARLPGGFDQVGDIALVGITPEAQPVEQGIGAAILALHRQIRVVAKRVGHHGGIYRTLPLQIIAGEQRLTTVHRENGISLHLDLGQVYFSVRSAQERSRIAAMVSSGETVAALCSGAGPFPLIIARHSHAGEIVGIEKNPAAHNLAVRNHKANRSGDRVRFYAGDATQVLPALHRLFDRILIVLPYAGEALLPCALAALRPGGMLHFYDMQAKDSSAAAITTIEAACKQQGRHLRGAQSFLCGHCGPRVYRVCVDATID